MAKTKNKKILSRFNRLATCILVLPSLEGLGAYDDRRALMKLDEPIQVIRQFLARFGKRFLGHLNVRAPYGGGALSGHVPPPELLT